MADIDIIISNIDKYKKLAKDKLLKVLQIEADKSVKMNFIDQGRPGKWRAKLFADGRNILTGKTGALLLRTTSKILASESKVVVGNTLPYGKIQNEGGKINVTSKMRKFFWAKMYENGTSGTSATGRKTFIPNEKGLKWRNMALSKKGFIEIPERRYLIIPEGDFPRIQNNMQKVINNITI